MSKPTRIAVIDLPFANHFGINLNVGAVYNAMRFAPTYCKAKEIEGETYYFMSRNMMCEKLALITDKPDTMYRYYKKLQQVGLVKLAKVGVQDYVHIIPEHAEKWNTDVYPSLGRSSEQLGRSSENTPQNTDVHPTYIREYIKGKEERGASAPALISEKVNDTVTPSPGSAPPPSPGDEFVKRHGQPSPKGFMANDLSDKNLPEFEQGSPECYDSILERVVSDLKAKGDWERIASKAHVKMTKQQFFFELKVWVTRNQNNKEFYQRPTRSIRGGKSSFASWLANDISRGKYGANKQERRAATPTLVSRSPIRKTFTDLSQIA